MNLEGMNLMQENEKLKNELIDIRENEFELEDENRAYDYARLMLKYIGDTDPELRDDLIYITFYKWIFEKEYFNKEELKKILEVALDDDHLFYKLGNDEDDSVFTRAFSALVIALILAYHRKDNFIEYEFFVKIKSRVIKYFEGEKDMRTHVGEKGWADSIAHGADVLDELVACEEIKKEDCLKILDVIGQKLINNKYFINEDVDERITNAVFRMVDNDLVDGNNLINWFETLHNKYESTDGMNFVKRRVININIKNVNRSLYFRLLHNGYESDIVEALIGLEKRFNRFIK